MMKLRASIRSGFWTQTEGISGTAKAAFGTALPFGGRGQLLVGRNGQLQDRAPTIQQAVRKAR